MKRIISYMLMLVAFVAFSTPTFAQNNTKQRKTREQMVEAQAQHIAKTMAFDDATSTRFVKTFCEYQKEVWALGPRQRPQRKEGQSQSEADAEKAMKERFAHSQKILNLREKYYGEYSKFLTQKQIQRVYQLERQMMQRLSKQRSGKQGRPGNKPINRPNK